ncbi:hypothetical protein HETIRDRAFT_412432 [Heterobasidion irregulare TC 32-1]|uniref:Uncharacterized protein n=1 Tax=Heterobasidion irregulare (strain TC 32-1) TaxID=747525 RepID=W4JNY8_HETIT|nr:uncharacterized protein HETIRDRAFT_412432 [Heterobasidion irregulare TC 32-1]ETW75204.1 hypothetical protein HETIRDRAFT_412432 [Heterobasidion irregulare TC 32-1]
MRSPIVTPGKGWALEFARNTTEAQVEMLFRWNVREKNGSETNTIAMTVDHHG